MAVVLEPVQRSTLLSDGNLYPGGVSKLDGGHHRDGSHQINGDFHNQGGAHLNEDAPIYIDNSLDGDSHLNANSPPSHPFPPESKPQVHVQPPISLDAVPQPSSWKPPPSIWAPQVHPLVAQVSETVENYFLQTWRFPTPESRTKFLRAGFSRVTCLYFPMAKDDRIEFACKLLTALFLIDDQLESMSLQEGNAYNESLMPIMAGNVEPDRTVPAQLILYDLWTAMRAHDPCLTPLVLEPTFTFMRAQTAKERLNMNGFARYFEYREKDVGKGLLSALMLFSMDLHLPSSLLLLLSPLERYCARHISAVNDITSYEKEFRTAQNSSSEGAILCSAVKVVMEETGTDVEQAKMMLWLMVREWERVIEELKLAVEERLGKEEEAKEGESRDRRKREDREGVRLYIRGLEHQMSGNEAWSVTTGRYVDC